MFSKSFLKSALYSPSKMEFLYCAERYVPFYTIHTLYKCSALCYTLVENFQCLVSNSRTTASCSSIVHKRQGSQIMCMCIDVGISFKYLTDLCVVTCMHVTVKKATVWLYSVILLQ